MVGLALLASHHGFPISRKNACSVIGVEGAEFDALETGLIGW